MIKIISFAPILQGVGALWSPHTGIVDWGLVTEHYAEDFQRAGGVVHLSTSVQGFREAKDCHFPVEIATSKGVGAKSWYPI